MILATPDSRKPMKITRAEALRRIEDENKSSFHPRLCASARKTLLQPTIGSALADLLRLSRTGLKTGATAQIENRCQPPKLPLFDFALQREHQPAVAAAVAMLAKINALPHAEGRRAAHDGQAYARAD